MFTYWGLETYFTALAVELVETFIGLGAVLIGMKGDLFELDYFTETFVFGA